MKLIQLRTLKPSDEARHLWPLEEAPRQQLAGGIKDGFLGKECNKQMT